MPIVTDGSLALRLNSCSAHLLRQTPITGCHGNNAEQVVNICTCFILREREREGKPREVWGGEGERGLRLTGVEGAVGGSGRRRMQQSGAPHYLHIQSALCHTLVVDIQL